ncbi:hypothetical protein [Bradymonas sediminis]|nr:hypothetical protein [Bradymonas sediminis]TDP73415.1 hypothetical protein DFR33_10655 [Bradymonas sediminis]
MLTPSKFMRPLCTASFVASLSLALVSAGCFDDNNPPQGLSSAQESAGPTVVFDLDTWPFPDIPFPNDLATRVDPSSPTGKRINVSLQGASDAEAKVRDYVNRMSGFGVFTPITVAFDAPLDIENIIARHQGSVPDLADDAVYIVNVDPKSPNFGEFALIDMGAGSFPLTLDRPDGYFANDPRRLGTNLLFETYEEVDLNGNGVLDPIEDTDDDGVWDRPNTRTVGGDLYDVGEMLDFYERETNTLVLRTLEPLDEKTTYAVVLTDALVGEDDAPVQSPFKSINHLRQTEDLNPLKEILPAKFPQRFSESLDSVRFAWTFTTGAPTHTLETIRAGLYGHGSLAWLAEEYPAEFKLLHNPGEPGRAEPLTFSLENIIPLIAPAASQALGSGGNLSLLEDAIGEIDYMVSGSFISPYFLGDSDGLAKPGADATIKSTNPQDEDEVFDVDTETGRARVRPGEVSFHCAVPASRPGRTQPYPVVLYSHAIGSTRLEMIAFAGQFAKFGLASCAIDAAGHGINIPPDINDILETVSSRLGLPGFGAMLRHDRARDLVNNGEVQTGEDFFTSEILHARDMIRQTAVDQMQLIRILRSFDGKTRWSADIDTEDPWIADKIDIVGGWDQTGDGKGEIRGDFDGDGVVDFGGEQPYLAFGTSLGGLQTGVISGIEPTIRAAATNAGGGGLGDIAARTSIRNVRVGVFLSMFGPLLTGTAPTNEDGEITGPMTLEWQLPSGIRDVSVRFGTLEGIENGDRVVLRNPKRESRGFIPEEERQAAVLVRGGRFRVGIAADAKSASARRAILGFDASVDVQSDLMQCKGGTRCDTVTCEGWEYCAADVTCRPLHECIEQFDPASVAPEMADELAAHTAQTPTDLGDPLIIEVYGSDGKMKQSIDTFPENLIFQNILYPQGAPLASLITGWGLKRQTPRFRKFLGISQMLLEVADPAIYAKHYNRDPLKYPYETPEFQSGWANMLVVGTLGDQTVPINSALSLARSAGILDAADEVEEYGSTQNQFLNENFVAEGIYWLNRFPEYPGTIFDPDDLDGGHFYTPRLPDNMDPNPDAAYPLRATVHTDQGISALRLPYLDTRGEHTFNIPRTDRGFDISTFMTNQVGWFMANYGTQLSDDPCMEALFMEECDFFDVESFTPPTIK